MKRRSRKRSSNNNRLTAVLILVIILLGSVALYYSPLLDGIRTRTTDPAEIYERSNKGIVTIRAMNDNSSVLGTGFVITYEQSYYIVTNFHLVYGYGNPTVTFSDGTAYPARVVGSDGYSDLAVVAVNAPASAFYPLKLGSSANLKVGETVVAIGNPYGYSNTITVGIVSHTGRSIQTGLSGNFAIANTIQFSAPINPGNSGGPLINPVGMVVAITTASVTLAQGLGFAIPSDTITRELPFLVKNGRYDKHPYLGVEVVDMSYALSQVMQSNVTWGVLIQRTVPRGPASVAGLKGGTQRVAIDQQNYLIGGDVITSIDGYRIVNYDSFSTYLEEHAESGQAIQVGVIRLGNPMVIQVVLGARPTLRA